MINSYKMGPGSLTLGAADLEVGCQLSSASVVPAEEVNSSEAVNVLCGDVLPAEDEVTYAYTLTGSMLQDLAAAGVVDYTWANAGDEVEFTFIPNTVTARKVTGIVRLIPLTIGGDVKTRPSSDFTWVIIGTPVFGAV